MYFEKFPLPFHSPFSWGAPPSSLPSPTSHVRLSSSRELSLVAQPAGKGAGGRLVCELVQRPSITLALVWSVGCKKYCRPGGLPNRHWSLTLLEAEVRDWGAGGFCFWWARSTWLADGDLPQVCMCVNRKRKKEVGGISLPPSYKATSCWIRTPPCDLISPSLLPKGPVSKWNSFVS